MLAMNSPRSAKSVGKGVSDRPGLKRIVIAFDDETFDQVRALALKNKSSFAQQVRLLVEWGLESDAQ